MSDRAILLVDDEKHILSALRRLLRKEPYTVHFAESGREGLEILAEHSVQLVLSDYRMPEMDGVEFLKKVKEEHPYTVRCVLSGFADAQLIVDAINHGEIYRFLSKPWNDDELKATIIQCLEHHEMKQQNVKLMIQTELQNQELQRLNDRLEEMVAERTRTLQLSQEILEKLPIGVVGISREREIVLTNEVALATLPPLAKALPGADIETALSSELATQIETAMNSGVRGEPIALDWEDRRITAYMEPLGETESERGCILVLETERVT